MEAWPELFEEIFGLRYDERSWKSLFGLCVDAVEYLWVDVLRRSDVRHRKYLLWALHFLRCYNSNDTAHCLFGVTRNTYRVHVWKVIFALDRSLHSINFNERLHDPELGNTFLCIDTKVCPIRVDRTDWDTQKIWYDGYHKKHGMKYQLAVHPRTGRIHHVIGGTFGSVSDIQLLRHSGVLERLLPGERVYSDKAYEGEYPTVLCPFKGRSAFLAQWKLDWNAHINSIRVLVENSINRVSKFQCISHQWRHSLSLHPVIFNVCTQLADLDIFFNPLRL